jgi:hypothetical protein
MAAVLGTVLLTMAVPLAAGGAGVVAGRAAPVTLRHARQCASVRRATAQTIVVPVVVDTGGASATAEVACVPVRAGSNGAQVLAARAKLLHVPAPRYAESGLLCAIDGYPATGCGVQTGQYYAYWAYYHGGSSWTYASVGPAEWKVSAGDVEGWRFQPEGTATPADPPPRAPSEASVLCPSSPPPSTTTTLSPPTTSPPTTVSTGPGHSDGSDGSSAPGPSTAPSSSSSSASAPSSSSAGKRSSPTTSSTPVPSTTATTRGSATPPGDVIELSPSGKRTAVRLAASRPPPGHGGGSLWIYVALALILVLAAAAVVRTRLTKAG